MGEMIERVARAIVAADAMGSEAQARAAIAAMREPTRAMADAANRATDDGAGNARTTWRAMIDAALASEAA